MGLDEPNIIEGQGPSTMDFVVDQDIPVKPMDEARYRSLTASMRPMEPVDNVFQMNGNDADTAENERLDRLEQFMRETKRVNEALQTLNEEMGLGIPEGMIGTMNLSISFSDEHIDRLEIRYWQNDEDEVITVVDGHTAHKKVWVAFNPLPVQAVEQWSLNRARRVIQQQDSRSGIHQEAIKELSESMGLDIEQEEIDDVGFCAQVDGLRNIRITLPKRTIIVTPDMKAYVLPLES